MSLKQSSVGPEIKAVMDRPLFKGGRWGLHVVDLANGTVIYDLNPRQTFHTGSTAKIFSVTAATALLGADSRFQTPVFQRGTVSNGTLTGDLILHGRGDLTLGGRTMPDGTIDVPIFDHFDANVLPGMATLTPEDPLAGLDELARQVRAAGITSVAGDVVVDDRLWDQIAIGRVPISPIVVNDNVIDLVVTPGAGAGDRVTLDWRPRTAQVTVTSTVTAGPSISNIHLKISDDGNGNVTIKGDVPAGHKPVVQTWQAPEPGAFARTLFIEALARAGVTVSAAAVGANPKARLPADLSGLTRVALFTSPPFSETARLINKVSHNLGANMLPFLMGVARGHRDHDSGLAIELDFAIRGGVDEREIVLTDGQGRSDCKVSPRGMTTYLRYLSERTDFPTFFDSMPLLGVDGSLASAVPAGDPATGHVHAKTGTLVAEGPNGGYILRTKALAGYIDAKSGRHLAFAIFVNDVPIPKVPDVLDANRAIGHIASLIYQSN